MNYRLFLIYPLLFLVCFSSQLNAQNNTVKSNADFRKRQNERAIKHIQALRNSTVIVRLETHAKEIAYYRKYKNFSEADKIVAETKEMNVRIMNGFRNHFTFTKVLFMPDTSSKLLLDRQYDKLVFYNNLLEADTSIHFSDSIYYVVELGYTRNDRDDAFRNDFITEKTDSGTVHMTRQYETGNMGIRGFVMMDRHFDQLADPFPYYTRYRENKWNNAKMVERIQAWNEMLLKFSANYPQL